MTFTEMTDCRTTPESRLDERHVALARSLHARLYVNFEGRIFAVGGEVAHARLAAALVCYDRPPTAVEAPTPEQLGIDACDGELPVDAMDRIRDALDRWETELECEARHKRARRRERDRRQAERREVTRLRGRWALVRQWQARFVAGDEPAGAPLFFGPDGEAALRIAIAEAERRRPLGSFIAWQARVVAWLTGDCAVRRYLSAVTGLMRSEACKQTLAACDGRRNELPPALAALAAADGSAVPLPRRTFVAGEAEVDFVRLKETIAGLAEQIGLPGYDTLLAALDGIPPILHRSHYGRIRALLAKRNSPADVTWAFEHDMHYYLTDSCLKIEAVRRIAAAFARCGMPLSDSQLAMIVGRISKPSDIRFVGAWTRWLGSVCPRALSPRLRTLIDKSFWETYLAGVERRGWYGETQRCVAPLKKGPPGDDLESLLEAIGALGRSVERPDALPKTLRNLLESDERRRRELAYLRARAEAGELAAPARARLVHLENGAAPDDDRPAGRNGSVVAKLRRTAEKSFLRLGVEALRNVARKRAETQCREHLEELVPRLPRSRLAAFADWIEKMSLAERNRLRTLVVARRRYGADYKRYLAENRAWIDRAAAHGLRLDPWFAAEAERVSIGGRAMEIGVAGDLLEIFQMGSYFETCLSLGEQNEMSVLTNAFDANKQVVLVFAVDAGRRRAVARQLISVSRDFKLLGYYSYVNEPRTGETNRPEIVEAMARYVGRLAARCGLELADEGEPEPIGDHFWYEDDTHPWPEAARVARRCDRREVELAAPW